MKIELYNTSSSNNTINKVLEDVEVYDITFKGVADVIRPSVKIQSKKLLSFNYAFIPDFKRYYFINNISIQPNNIYIVNMRVDVLESYKDDILKCSGFVNRQQNINNYYNNEYEFEERKEIEIIESTIKPEYERTTIISTIGG